MLVTRSAALVFWVLFLTTASTVAGFMVSPGGYLSPLASPSLLGATEGISGSISIGPIFPICRTLASTVPAPSYYNQIQVLVTPVIRPRLDHPRELDHCRKLLGPRNLQDRPEPWNILPDYHKL